FGSGRRRRTAALDRRGRHHHAGPRHGHARSGDGGGAVTLLSGMTGFGRAEGALDGWTWAVEARSVNGRNLEVRFRGPTGFDNLERLAKAAGQARLNRGQVTIGLQARRAPGDISALKVNEAVLARYLQLANQL